MEHFNLSLNERDRRYAAIRAEMAKEDIDVLIIQANEASIKYIANTNWIFPMEHVIFPLEGNPIIILHGEDWVHCNCEWINNYELFNGRTNQVSDLAKKFYKGNKVGMVRGSGQGIGNSGLQFEFYTDLLHAFGDKLVSADKLFIEIVQIKSPEEQECLVRSANICDKAFHYVLDNCMNTGTLDYDICAEVMKIYYQGGNDGYQMLWIEASKGNNIGYSRPWGKRLQKGSSFVIEFAPGYNGYESEIVFSLPVDKKLSEFMREKYKLWQEAFYTAKDMIKIGVRACDVAVAIDNLYKKHGIGLRPDYGHGLGLSLIHI